MTTSADVVISFFIIPKGYRSMRKAYITFLKEIYRFPVQENITVVAEIPFRNHRWMGLSFSDALTAYRR